MPGHGLKNIHTASLLLDSILLLTSLFMLSSCLYLQCSHVFLRAFSVPERVSYSPKGTGLPLPLLSLSRVHKVWSQKISQSVIHNPSSTGFVFFPNCWPYSDLYPFFRRAPRAPCSFHAGVLISSRWQPLFVPLSFFHIYVFIINGKPFPIRK